MANKTKTINRDDFKGTDDKVIAYRLNNHLKLVRESGLYILTHNGKQKLKTTNQQLVINTYNSLTN